MQNIDDYSCVTAKFVQIKIQNGPDLTICLYYEPFVLQNDRPKAQKAMEATWISMEKKEKIMWIKKAAEDQKRYEARLCALWMSCRPSLLLYTLLVRTNR